MFQSGRHLNINQRRYSVLPAVFGLSLLAFGQAGNGCMQDSDLRSAAWKVAANKNLGVRKHFSIACECLQRDITTLQSVCVKTIPHHIYPPFALYLYIWFCLLLLCSGIWTQNHNRVSFHFDSPFPPSVDLSWGKKKGSRHTFFHHVIQPPHLSINPETITLFTADSPPHASCLRFLTLYSLLCFSAKPNKPTIKMS